MCTLRCCFMLITSLTLAVTAGGALAGDGASLATELVADGFVQPTYATFAPNDPERIFVLEKRGIIRLIKNGVLEPMSFLDIDSTVPNETFNGLLGLAFDPDYETNGYFYVQHPLGPASSNRISVARYSVTENPDLADASSRTTILEINYPSFPGHHVGGWIGFGPDDYLYIPLGDGGTTGQETAGGLRAQSFDSHWGKVLRIDPHGDGFPADPLLNYAVPPDSPFIGEGTVEATWLYGLRQPFRATFDRETGDFWIADVGLFQREEIDFIPAGMGGLNFGWNCAEGTLCQPSAACVCPDDAIIAPIYDYSHSFGCTISGGAVYRGCAIPELTGAYIYGDYCSGRSWTLHFDGETVTDVIERTAELDPPGADQINSPVAYTEDFDGEILIVDYDGEIFRVINNMPPPEGGLPDPCAQPLEGDLDSDGDVDFNDLLTLLAAWGDCDPKIECAADLDQSGVVGFNDLLILLANWS